MSTPIRRTKIAASPFPFPPGLIGILGSISQQAQTPCAPGFWIAAAKSRVPMFFEHWQNPVGPFRLRFCLIRHRAPEARSGVIECTAASIGLLYVDVSVVGGVWLFVNHCRMYGVHRRSSHAHIAKLFCVFLLREVGRCSRTRQE